MVSKPLELKEERQERSRESKYVDREQKQKDALDCQGGHSKSTSQIESNITDVEGDNIRPAKTSNLGLGRESLSTKTDSIGQDRETFKPEICIHDDTKEDDLEKERPKTKSRGVTAKTQLDSENWNTIREDDDAFAARVKEEEQKILGLAVEQQSQGATPDTTPGRTPTEEGTPTSEQNPFLFQEGKLFEMTRSGAIDMTKRGYEEEGFAYFQIGEQPIEEALVEDIIGESVAERDVPINPLVNIKPEDSEECLKEATDLSLNSMPKTIQSGTASKLNASQSVSIKSPVSTTHQTSKKCIPKEAVEVKKEKLAEDSFLGQDLGSSDAVITDVQTAESTVTRSVYSQQDQESSDSSPEDEHSVIELPKAPEKVTQSPKIKSKTKTKPDSKGYTTSTQKKLSFSKEEEKPKSRIPIKAVSHKSETEKDSRKNPKEKKSKLPVKPETRRKSETDTGPSVSSRVTRSIKSKSFCESDPTKKPAKKDQGRSAGTELPNKCKTLPSKLPVRGQPGQPTQTTTTGKKEQLSERCTKPDDFFEEISDEAAKLVERLAQAEKEKEEAAAMSDDDSSTIDVSVIESEPFPDMQMPLPEDPLVIRPRWDDPVETQMERIPADKAQVQSQVDPQEELDRKEGRLAVMADHLGFSWTELARELEFDEEQVSQIRLENPNSLQDQKSILISKLTKINRMDIVHLIEAKITQSTQDRSSHTYAEMEQSITLDHSEGFSALHEDIGSPRPVRHTELTSGMSKSGLQPPLVSVEDLSSSVSSLSDTQKEKLQLQTDVAEGVVEGSTLSGFEMIGLRQQFPGTVKKVSPFFTLYKTAPWRLQSQQYGPVYKEQAVFKLPSKNPLQHLKPIYDEALQGLEAAGGQSVNKNIGESIIASELPRNCKQKQKEIMTDFEETLLESEHSEADFSEIAVELKQAPEDYSFHYASTKSLQFFQPSDKTVSGNVTLAQDSSETENPFCQMEEPSLKVKKKNVYELPSNPKPSDEYMRQHVEEISAKFYRALFGKDHTEAKTPGKDVSIVTESFVSAKHEDVTINKVDSVVDEVTFELSAEVNHKAVVQSIETTNTIISTKEQLKKNTTVYSLPPKQLLPWHEGDISASNTDSILSEMSIDSATGQTNFSSNPIIDESETIRVTTRYEEHKTESEFTATNSQYEAKYSSVTSIPVLDDRPSVQDGLISLTECRSSSPVSVSEYNNDLEIHIHEYRSLSPESTVSLPPDSPIPFEYKSGSLDLCMPTDMLGTYSYESVASSIEQNLLYPDSPIPDFRPHSPLPPVRKFKPPNFTPQILEPSNQLCSFNMLVSNAQFSPQRSVLSDELSRPVSPASRTECRSLTPESTGSLSPGSFTSDTLDRELFPVTPQDSEQCIWTSDMLVDRTPGPGSTISLNECGSLLCDSPIPSFTPEVYNNFTQVRDFISSSPRSEISDLEYKLSELLFENRLSSPESAASVNECLFSDSPLPNFVQNVNEITHVPECGFLDNKYESISPIVFLEECRPLSPDSLSSVTEHIPLSPDSPIPSFSLPICTSYTAFRCHSESNESDLSDRENLISPTLLFENRPSSPDSVSSLNIPRSHSADYIFPNISTHEDKTKLLQSQQQSAEVLEIDTCLNNNALDSLLVSDCTELTAKITSENKLTYSEFASENITKTPLVQLSTKIKAKKIRKVKKILKNATQEKESVQPPEQVESILIQDCNLDMPSTTDPGDSESTQQPNISGLSKARPSVIGHVENPFKESDVATNKRSYNLISKVNDPQYKGKTFCPNTTFFEYSVKTDTQLSSDLTIQPVRPIFSETSLLDQKENETFAKGLFVIEQNTETTESFQARSLSPDSIPEYRPMSPESITLTSNIRGSSPDSVSACGPLSPDSPIPQYSDLFCQLIEHRMSSPVSMASDTNNEDDYELNGVTHTVSRASSPDSIKSVDENRPLSPDSPIQQFRPLLYESVLLVSGYRSCSPESIISGSIENESFAEELLAIEQRPESPESVESEIEARPLSPDSIPEYRPLSPDSINLALDVRGSSPDSISACRPLSPDSPVPQYSAVVCEVVPMTGCRSSSLESLASDSDTELNIFTVNYDYRTSLESLAAIEHLPPDSPVPDFRSSYFGCTLGDIKYRSCSPDSVYSNSIDNECLDLFTVEQRLESPDSFQSKCEDRSLSPDSISEYKPMSPECMILPLDRGSSPDSVSACGPLSPDSPIPQYSDLFCQLIEHRMSSPVSMASDTNNEDDNYELNVVTYTASRASSPDSMKSADENRPLSPDSPIQQFRPLLYESVLSVSGYRSCSPESIISGSIENESFAEELLAIEQRPESPESVESEIEARPLSPDSIPEYRAMSPYSMDVALDNRGSSPDSISACRPLSPDSPVPQYSAVVCEVVPMTGCRSSSLESLASVSDTELNIFTVNYDYRTSLESLAAIEHLPPDSPVPDFRSSYFGCTLGDIKYRSCSPDSVYSNSIDNECLDLFTVEQRLESPDSFQSKCEDRSLSPDSISEYKPMSPECMILPLDRGSSPDSVSACGPLSPDSPIPQYSDLFCQLIEHRMSSPVSMASDTNNEDDNYELNVVTYTASRASSPDSMKSADENRPLSPDSPIQQFRPLLYESVLSVSGYRSCSPESIISGSIENESFAEELLAIEQRPESPESVESEIEARPLSPDSIPEYRAMSPECMTLPLDRGSSPDSVSAYRPLSPDSPIPQYSGLFCQLMSVVGHRSCSPESVASKRDYDEDDDYEINAIVQMVSRASSPVSMELADKHRPLPPDSPIQQFQSFFLEGSLPVSGYKSYSPESLYSNSIENETFAEELIVTKERAESMSNVCTNLASDIRGSSPDSISECRPLSPDSPVPQYSGLFCEFMPVAGHRSCSPESVSSDKNYEKHYDEYELNVFTKKVSRASSPDSIKSADENRSLSPDSPVQQFGQFFPEISFPISGFRSCSPVSMCSNSVEHETLSINLFNVIQNPGSPDSCIPLSIDSPIPQYSTTLEDLVLEKGYRSSFSESLASDIDNAINILSGEDSNQRLSSPDSMASVNKNTRLSPDSPIQAFRPVFLESTLPVSGYRSCSPESICSNSIEYELVTESEIRGASPDSINADRPLSKDSPIPQYSAMLLDLVTGHSSPSSKSIASDKDYECNVFTSVPFDNRPALPDTVVSEDKNSPLLSDSTDPQFQETIKMVPEYKLVYKTIPLNFISHIYDPHYKGEMFSYKTGMFEYTGCRMEIVHTCKMESNVITDKSGNKTPALTQESSQISMQTQKILTIPVSENQIVDSLKQTMEYNTRSFQFPEENFTDAATCFTPEGHESLVISDDLRASSPESIGSVNEFKPLSSDSPIPECMCLLPHTTIFQLESRPPSPESVSSVNEFQRLSPDSPIPEFLAHSPVPYNHNVQLSGTNLIRISPTSDILALEYGSLWPETKQRSESPGYELSECGSRSLSSPTFSIESICRYPSLEALRETEPTVSVTPDPMIFDVDCRPISPESITSQTQYEIFIPDNQSNWTSNITLLPVITDEKRKSEIEINSESDIDYVLNSGSRKPPWHEFVSEPEQEEKISKTKEEPRPVIEKVEKMSAGHENVKSILSIMEDHQRIRIAKQDLELHHKQGLEERSDSPSTEIDQQEFETRALQDKFSEKDIQLEKQNRERKNDYSSVSEEEVKEVQNQSTSVVILEQKAESSLPSEGSIQPDVSDPHLLHFIPEDQPKETSGLNQSYTTFFNFSHQQSHRTVTPNLSVSSSPFSNCKESSFVRTPFLNSTGQPTSSMTPVASKLFSNQELPTYSQLSIEKQIIETGDVVSEVEKHASVISTDDADLVAGEKYPMKIALAPTSSEISQFTDQRKMDDKLKKAKPRPVQADSLESDTEFFDCQQTFSDVSEPEIKSEENLDSEMLYHCEEALFLPNTPVYDYLSVMPKITEKSEADSQDSPRPVSWGSEEIDLPIVLEPEDECEHEEEFEYSYGYVDKHFYPEELPPRQEGQYDEDNDSLGREIAAELGLLSDSSEEEVLTTRVVRRRVIIQGDELPEISPCTVTEEQYTDEHGNVVTKKITRKIIRKYVSADGVEREEVRVEGAQQEAITVDDADGFSKVVKRTVVRSAGDQTEVTFSEVAPVGKATPSEFEEETVKGRKVSKVIKSTVVQGERMEKQIGDPSLSADLPSAKEDFEKALGYAGGFDKVLLPHLVEKDIVKEDGSMIRRTRMRKTRSQKKTVVMDGQSKHTHLERLEDTPESLQPDHLQQHLHQLLQRYCTPEVKEVEEEAEEEEEEVKEKQEKQDKNN
ncbi:Ankyrin-2 [Bagarius yarrelli]|uniref:Ankyrin-2 n=1 Tax=Bagarius yarrelli TaxID=175774 RepID=A0A556TYQ1_BAGYA|nr:Ankyrin-2 [Bagarius yarrelli]